MHFQIRKNLYLSAFPKNNDEIVDYTHILSATTNFCPLYSTKLHQKYLQIPLVDIS